MSSAIREFWGASVEAARGVREKEKGGWETDDAVGFFQELIEAVDAVVDWVDWCCLVAFQAEIEVCCYVRHTGLTIDVREVSMAISNEIELVVATAIHV